MAIIVNRLRNYWRDGVDLIFCQEEITLKRLVELKVN